jgi:hypothetical protein
VRNERNVRNDSLMPLPSEPLGPALAKFSETITLNRDPPAAFSASYVQPPEKTEAPDLHAVGPRR